MWKQLLISLIACVLILHPSPLIFEREGVQNVCVCGLLLVTTDILILEPMHLVALVLCFHSNSFIVEAILTSQFVAYSY